MSIDWSKCRLKYYVLNETINREHIGQFNVFNNYYVNDRTVRDVRKYLRSPKKFSYRCSDGSIIYGFDALVKRIDLNIKCEEWSRCEYEIIVKSLFSRDETKNQKIDCYQQCSPNIEMITRECIYQVNQFKKKGC